MAVLYLCTLCFAYPLLELLLQYEKEGASSLQDGRPSIPETSCTALPPYDGAGFGFGFELELELEL